MRSPAGGRRALEGFGSRERASLAGDALQVRGQSQSVLDEPSRAYNGLEMSRPASASILHQTRFAAAGQVGSIELLGGFRQAGGALLACDIHRAASVEGSPRTGKSVTLKTLGVIWLAHNHRFVA